MRYSHVVFDIDGTMTDTEKPDSGFISKDD